MGISNIFDIASSGVMAQRLAIEVAGENIANINTEGYSRQQVIMENAPITSTNGFPLGTGVQVQAVRRSYDGMLQKQIMDGSSTYQQNLTRQAALEQIQPSFNELASDGLGKAVDNFFASWQDLSANPAGSAERQSLLSKAQIMVDNFHNMDTNLTTVSSTANNNLVGITDEMSTDAKSLALVNWQIISANAVGGNPNELLDKRDLLIRQLSEKAGVTSTIASDNTATVTLAGGQQLVAGAQYATIYANNVAGSNNVMITAVGNPPAANNPATDANITATVGGANNSLGEIGGTLQVRDTIVPGYRARLDEMASKLVSAVNTQHALGYGTDGTTGNNFFAPAGTTAASIALNGALTVAKISAALPTATDPAPTSSGNNGNALKIADIQKSALAFTTGNATFSGYYSALVGKVGSDTQGAQNLASQGESFLKQLNNLRASNSGVSLDEELTNLTKYQQAFQGSARVINVATEMLDTVLGLVR